MTCYANGLSGPQIVIRSRSTTTDKKVVFCVFKDHIDGFIFENNFLECHDVFMRKFSV